MAYTSSSTAAALDRADTVRVLPRLVAERRTPLVGEVCISITNPRQSPAALPAFAEVLRLGFHDTDRVGGGFTPMSAEDAGAVLEFGRRHAQTPLMVHCEAGASRSAAVGLFLAAWLYRPLHIASTDVLVPNPWVLNQLRAAALARGARSRDWRLLCCALRGTTDYLAKKIRHD